MTAEFRKGSNDEFEVTVDEKLVFSRLKTGRFPKKDETVKLIKEAFAEK